MQEFDINRIKSVLAGASHETLEDAIAADLVSIVPIIGEASDLLRILDSDTKPKKALQLLDTITDPIPILNLVTPTNTVLYLDSKGLLPFKLDKINKITEKLLPKPR